MGGPALRLSQIDAEQKMFKGFLDVPYQIWSTGSTVADLERGVSSQTGLRVVYIAYRGMRLATDTQLSSLILDLQQGPCPRLSVHTTSGKNVFFVKSLRGNSVMVDIPLDSSTVTELKEEVQALEKIPTKYQRFIYNGKQFTDSGPITKTLHDYGVERGSTVQLLTRLRGGGGGAVDLPVAAPSFEFSDLQNESALKVKPWSTTAPIWRTVGHGLNLEGKCTNKSCSAHGRLVVCKKGFVAFNVAKEQGQCPVCKQTVLVMTCSFTSCTWMYEGRKLAAADVVTQLPSSRGVLLRRFTEVTSFLSKCFTGKSSIKDEEDDPITGKKLQASNGRDIVSPWFKASNQYEYFEVANNMVLWESLIIVAKKCPTVSKAGPDVEIPQDEPCSICFQRFEASRDAEKVLHTTSCGHTFHADCVESWLSHGGTACPICRVDLAVEK